MANFLSRHKERCFVMFVYGGPVRIISHTIVGVFCVVFFYFPYITRESYVVQIVLVSKWFAVAIISLLLKLTFLGRDIVNAVQLYITSSFWQAPLHHLVLTRQFSAIWWFRFVCFLQCPFIVCDIFWVQL